MSKWALIVINLQAWQVHLSVWRVLLLKVNLKLNLVFPAVQIRGMWSLWNVVFQLYIDADSLTDTVYANAFWSWVHTILYITVFIFTGDVLQYEDGQSPLHSLEQAAVHHASAIRLSWRDARLHFLLGVVLEEQHYATLMYGLQRKVWWPAAAKHA